jgi:hypothetical protein
MIKSLELLLEIILDFLRIKKKTDSEKTSVDVDKAMDKAKADQTEDLQKEIGKLLK